MTATEKELPVCLRAFFAITLSFEPQKVLAEIVIRARKILSSEKIQWMPPEKLHITLQFIPKLRQEHIQLLLEKLKPEIQKIDFFSLQFRHLTYFPSISRPKLLVLEIKSSQSLVNLVHIIGNALEEFQYSSDRRPYRGHITLARLKGVQARENALENIPLLTIPPLEIHEISLFQSSGNLQYKELARLSLRRS